MFKGIITPVVAILDENRKLDHKGMKAMVEHLIENQVNGILFLGSIGEFFTMTMEERKEFVEFAVKSVNGRVPVLIGTGGTVVDEVIELTNYAESEGADGVVVISPYYFKLDDESIFRYFSEVAKNTKLPVLLYNFPDRTSYELSPELVLRLAREHKNIVGIKDTVDNISHTRSLIEVVKSEIKDFTVFSGFDEYMVPNLMAGGDGLIGGLSNVVPGLFAKVYRAFGEKDFNTVLECQQTIYKLMNIYGVTQPFVAAIKSAVQLVGVDITPTVKLPGQKATQEQEKRIQNILKDANIL
ncbi:MAG: 4-hydroxy-tetrahydrodipicolinate synthase [Thermotaleaceae bacterium]